MNPTDFSGSEAHAMIRISDRLLNEVVARELQQRGGTRFVKDVRLHARGTNVMEVQVSLAKPAFLPPLAVTVSVERQPSVPGDPVVVFKLGGVGGLLRFAGPLAGLASSLPPGVRLEGDLLSVDVRPFLEQHGYADLLAHARVLAIGFEEGRTGIVFQGRVE